MEMARIVFKVMLNESANLLTVLFILVALRARALLISHILGKKTLNLEIAASLRSYDSSIYEPRKKFMMIFEKLP